MIIAVTEQEIIDCGFTLESVISANETIYKQDNFLVIYKKPHYGYGTIEIYQPHNEDDKRTVFECEIRSKEEFKDLIEFCKKYRITK